MDKYFTIGFRDSAYMEEKSSTELVEDIYNDVKEIVKKELKMELPPDHNTWKMAVCTGELNGVTVRLGRMINGMDHYTARISLTFVGEESIVKAIQEKFPESYKDYRIDGRHHISDVIAIETS